MVSCTLIIQVRDDPRNPDDADRHTARPTVPSSTADRIRSLTLSHVVLPLDNPVSDAKVLTGRQKPLTETVMLFVEVTTEQGLEGMGFSYSKRAGGKAQYAHLKEVVDVAIGQDPSDIAKIYESLMWAGASVGRSGVATQAVAALDVALWDLKARRADLPLAKLLGAHRDSCRVYNTSGGFLQASVEEIKEKATASLESGIGGIKIKVGQPDWREDLRRVAALREHLGDGPFMVDANQQWDRARARRMCRELEAVRPGLDRGAARRVGRRRPRRPVADLRHPDRHRRDAHLGARAHGASSTPATAASCSPTRRASAASRRSSGSRPLPRTTGLALAPHYAMEIHLHLAAAYPTEPWVEHFEWLNPLFEERIDIHDGHMFVPDRPGLGFTLSERMRSLTVETATFGTRVTRRDGPLAQGVVAGLKDRILAGELAPGSKLPSEAELIEEYAVSRTVVREAVTRLRAEGLVETFQGRGSFVLALPEPSSFSVEASAIRTHRDVLAMVDFRLGVESEAAALAAAAPHPRRRAAIEEAMSGFTARRPRGCGRGRLRLPPRVAAPRANRFYVDLLGSLGPMMIMLPRTRLSAAYSMTDADPRRAGAARARQRRRRGPRRRRRDGARRDAAAPGQHPPPRHLSARGRGVVKRPSRTGWVRQAPGRLPRPAAGTSGRC